MAQIIYTTVPGNSPVEVDLQNLLHSAVVFNSETQDNSIVVDEADVFQCGRCKKNFTFPDFVFHKKNNCPGIQLNVDPTALIQSCHLNGLNAENNQILLDNTDLLNLVNNNDIEKGRTSQSIDKYSSSLDNHLLETRDANDELETYQLVESNTGFQNSILHTTNFIEDHNTFKSDSLPGDVQNVRNVQPCLPKNEVRNVLKNNCGDNDLKTMKCSFCDKPFRKNFDLQTHIRSHTGERPFQCIVCGRAFAQKSNVIKHMSTHKVWPKKKSTLPQFSFGYEDCKQSLDKRLNERRIIALQQSFVCQYCPSILKSYLEWKAHMKIHVSQKVYKCVQECCGETFSDLDKFLSHVFVHKDESRYSCHLCLAEFGSLDDLGQHQYSHDQSNPPKKVLCRKCSNRVVPGCHTCPSSAITPQHSHACPLCNRSFSEERYLRRHILLVHSPSQHQCQLCEKCFKTRQYLNSHIKAVHSAIKPYACNICTASFSSREKLVRHNLIHEKIKKFKCPFMETKDCNKEFNRKDKLKQHLLTHRDKSQDMKVNKDRKNGDWGGCSAPNEVGASTIEIYVVPVNATPNSQDRLGLTDVPLSQDST